MTAASEMSEKKPWYKKTWIWIIVAAVIVIGGISNLVNPRASDKAEPTPSETVVISEAPKETLEADPDAAQPEPVAPAGPTAEEFEASIKNALGGAEFSEIYASDPSLWGGYVSGVRIEGSNAFVTLQVAGDDPTRNDLGGRAAKALSTLLTADQVKGVSWIIVEDASGTVIAQQQPRPIL